MTDNNFQIKAFINPFKLFNITCKSNLIELKKSYYELSLMCHPDKGGRTEDMMVITSAYRFIKEQIIKNEDKVELDYENAEEEFQKYVENNPIPKTPMMSEVFDEYTDFNKKFNEEFSKNNNRYDKLSSLGYEKMMDESKIGEYLNEENNYDYNELLKLEGLNFGDKINTKEEKREEFKNRYTNDNIKFLENNEAEKDGVDPNYYNIYKPEYPDNAHHTSLILANDPLIGNYYDYSVEKNINNIEDLEQFPEEEILKKLNLDFGGKNYSDYYQSSNMLSYEIDDNLKEKINCDVMEKMNIIKKEEDEAILREKRREYQYTINNFTDKLEHTVKELDSIKKRKNKAYKKIRKLKKDIYHLYNNKNVLELNIFVYLLIAELVINIA